MTDTDRLAELAAAATPGPWRASNVTRHGARGIYPGEGYGPPPIFVTNSISDEDAAFIAACDPSTIRSLVVAVRERDELRAAAEKLIERLPGEYEVQEAEVELAELLGYEWVDEPPHYQRAAFHPEDGT